MRQPRTASSQTMQGSPLTPVSPRCRSSTTPRRVHVVGIVKPPLGSLFFAGGCETPCPSAAHNPKVLAAQTTQTVTDSRGIRYPRVRAEQLASSAAAAALNDSDSQEPASRPLSSAAPGSTDFPAVAAAAPGEPPTAQGDPLFFHLLELREQPLIALFGLEFTRPSSIKADAEGQRVALKLDDPFAGFEFDLSFAGLLNLRHA